MSPADFEFRPRRHEAALVGLIEALLAAERIDRATLDGVVARFPRDGRHLFSKSQIVRGIRELAPMHGWQADQLVRQLRRKPARTLSGVTPVAVLTRPHPCPGRCIFCPNDVRMPKSYLSLEPAAQRAARVEFDPYLQTWFRLKVFHNNGHGCEKVEMIVLGGTWSHYPESYRRWFVLRCLEAMNDFGVDPDTLPPRPARGGSVGDEIQVGASAGDGADNESGRLYNRLVARRLRQRFGGRLQTDREAASWSELEAEQRRNETARSRCVGLSIETRPDEVSAEGLVFDRRLGCTKVQIGYQSLSDEILRRNRRGHDVAAARRATALLREAGFKIHAHWMPNLLGADPTSDRDDFARLFGDPGLRPDELKIYPCSLVEGTELVRHHESGSWRPYSESELVALLTDCLLQVPEYCRVTRVIRDFSAVDIAAGNRTSNLRQIVEREMAARGMASRDIRGREIRHRTAVGGGLALRETRYDTAGGEELFLEWQTTEGRIAGFLRLSLPNRESFIAELGVAAVIREVHVYGAAADLGERHVEKVQHTGLGRRLIERAGERAMAAGFGRLAVISSVGTREYYRRLGFADGELYQAVDLMGGHTGRGVLPSGEAAATSTAAGGGREAAGRGTLAGEGR